MGVKNDVESERVTGTTLLSRRGRQDGWNRVFRRQSGWAARCRVSWVEGTG